ncbi:MAG: phosphohydrolase [Desulfuromonadales bacterium]|nr:phosphohydrolase [Desulfuromonadales bacterium]
MTTRLRPVKLLHKYYREAPVALQIILDHSRLVTARAVGIARRLQASETIDIRFIAEATMLHDIGAIFTYAPDLGCFGELPYLCHGIKGSEILNAEGLHRHALVCERHIGVGLTAAEIKKNDMPLPPRDMIPVTLEEQIICYADLFYSKNSKDRGREKDPYRVRNSLEQFGPGKMEIFDHWREKFEPGLS